MSDRLHIADLHIHSHYSRATSRDLDPEHLWLWAQRKGIGLVGTGDFTHAGWLAELKEKLVPASDGFYKLRADLAAALAPQLPAVQLADVRFVLSAEISSIYKQDDRVRKNHNVIIAPDFDHVEAFNHDLGKRGNLKSDGRPILGVSAHDLLELALEKLPDMLFIPAHIWTPWFSALGSKSGFDSIDACFGDLTRHIFAVETGLSSDPPMNWRVSSLDRFRLVSNSDAHSPAKLGREANLFSCDLTYEAVARALRGGEGFEGTIEFYPEEGKYHMDGHRKCNVCLSPQETIANNGLCPVCGKKVTVGVSARVEDLADRPEGFRPPDARDFESLIPLPEVIAEVVQKGPATKTVLTRVDALYKGLGSEFHILRHAPLEDIAAIGGSLTAEAVRRVRDGEVRWEPGYDGEFGKATLFSGDERKDFTGVQSFISAPVPDAPPAPRPAAKPNSAASPFEGFPLQLPEAEPPQNEASVPAGLDADQQTIVDAPAQAMVVNAGPGTGKTRVLVARLVRRLQDGVPPANVAALTFTRRAAEEMRQRVEEATGAATAQQVFIGTFHAFGMSLLEREPAWWNREPGFGLVVEEEAVALLADMETSWSRQQCRGYLRRLDRLRQQAQDVYNPLDDEELWNAQDAAIAVKWDAFLARRNCIDLTGLLYLPFIRLRDDADFRRETRQRFATLFVDEYQDVNPLQDALLRILAPAAATTDIMVIGDRWQAIYGFRGADAGFFQRFADDYDARVFRLKRNYRSSSQVVKAANVMVQKDRAAVLSPVRDGSGPVVLFYRAATDRAEAEFVAHSIERLLGGLSHFSMDSGRSEGAVGDWSPGDIAVLYRTHAQAELLSQALNRLGVPVRQSVGRDLSEEPLIRRLIAALRIWAARKHTSDIEDVALLSQLPAYRPDMPIADAVSVLAVNLGIDDAMRDLLWEASRGVRGEQMVTWLRDLVLKKEHDTVLPGVDAVHMMTMHGAKGLEFPVVFITGLEDGLSPFRRPGIETDMQEERCLFYVGITRAENRLILSWARRRALRGQIDNRHPSPFLLEIAKSGAALEHFEKASKRRKKASDPELPF